MDRILNFVSLRRPSQDDRFLPALAAASDFQQELAHAATGSNPLDDTTALARSFVESGRFLTNADEVNQGMRLLALYERLASNSPDPIDNIEDIVRQYIGDVQSTDWTQDAMRARDSVLAAYLLEDAAPSAATALALTRMYALLEAIAAGGASPDQLMSLLRSPLRLPDYLVGLRVKSVADSTPPTPDEAALALLEQFRAEQERHTRLTETLEHIVNHDEDELVLSELGEQRPLASMYSAAPTLSDSPNLEADRAAPNRLVNADDMIASSPLKRAATRSNVIFSDTAMRLLSEPARQTLLSLNLDPATSTVRDMQSRIIAEHQLSTQNMQTLSLKISGAVTEVSEGTKHLIAEFVGKWQVEPIDDPTPAEPVITTPPLSFNTVKPLGIADLFLVRTHLSRYERGEVASLENILGNEKLTHTVRQLSEVETTDSTDSDQTSLQSLAQTTAEQSSGKTTAQAIGAGRGPLVSEGPESFSKSVTDQVSSSSSNRNRKTSVLRRLQRNEEDMEHVFDNTAGADTRYGVYQWLDKIYQAQVFKYGAPRLLYDLIIPEPAALFREALSRPRGQESLPPRPAKFKVTADKLSLYNWSYYATGHQATGVEAPPQAEVIVAEHFGGIAPDTFSSELNANTLQMGQTRITRIPKGYKATSYRLVIESIGIEPCFLRAIIGSKHIQLDPTWGGRTLSGKLDNEVESLPIGLVATGNKVDPGLIGVAIGIEIICEPTEEAISAWQTKTHSLILAANQKRFADYEERVANRDATARLQLQSLSAARKAAIIQSELKRTTLAVLTNQNFSTFNANKVDSFGFPYPDAAATTVMSAYARFFEQAVEWEHLECAFFPYFWGSRSSWVSKLLNTETNPQFAAFLTSGAARVVLPIRPGYEAAFERFLNTGKTSTTDEMLDVGGPLWVSLVSQIRQQGAEESFEEAFGDPWEFRIASDLIRARRDGLLPKWTLNAGEWVEEPDANS